jgi:hypothetical protein
MNLIPSRYYFKRITQPNSLYDLQVCIQSGKSALNILEEHFNSVPFDISHSQELFRNVLHELTKSLDSSS